MTPILTIGIPTYNRADFLEETVKSIVQSNVFQNTDKVEIVISDNCSTDNTEEVCKKLIEKYGEKIIYIKQSTPLFPDVNMFKPIEYANGIYCKLNNDTCSWKSGMLDKTIEVIENNMQQECILFLNNNRKTKDVLTYCHSLDEIIKTVSVFITWVGIFCIKKETFFNMQEPLRYVETRFPITDIAARLCEAEKTVLVYNDNHFLITLPYKKGAKYNVAEAFGKNYFWVLTQHLNKKNGITKETFEKEKYDVNLFVNIYYYDYEEIHAFQRTGYLKHMFKYYKFNPYFYLNFISCFFKYNVFYFKKCRNHYYYLLRLFGKAFFIKRDAKKIWRKKNKKNKTNLLSENMYDCIFVGANTTGNINVIGNPAYNRGRLIIGKNVNISDGVKFYLMPDNEEKTYNFKNITVQDNVTIGKNVSIKAGVTIHSGANIADNCIITTDVPDNTDVKEVTNEK